MKAISSTSRRRSPVFVPSIVAFAAWLLLGGPAAAQGPAGGSACPQFDHEHAAWSALLEKHVHAGVVDYATLHRDDRPLRAYLGQLEAVCAADYATWPRSRRLAFWINAYNAYTMRLILDHYPIDSIRSIGFLPGAAFRTAFIPLQKLRGHEMTLQEIEDDILRGELSETRIHFAIVCASKSCPLLASRAYVGDRLDDQLDAAARGFLADQSKNRWEPATRTLHLSSILRWFRADFEKTAGSLEGYVTRYASPEVAAAIRAGNLRIEFLDYDWSLNGR